MLNVPKGDSSFFNLFFSPLRLEVVLCAVHGNNSPQTTVNEPVNVNQETAGGVLLAIVLQIENKQPTSGKLCILLRLRSSTNAAIELMVTSESATDSQ